MKQNDTMQLSVEPMSFSSQEFLVPSVGMVLLFCSQLARISLHISWGLYVQMSEACGLARAQCGHSR